MMYSYHIMRSNQNTLSGERPYVGYGYKRTATLTQFTAFYVMYELGFPGAQE